MKSEVSPVVIAIAIVLVVIVGGFCLWKFTGGKTFSKDEAQGRLEVKAIDPSKLNMSTK
ncbi:MAG: hypothetical protein ABJA67_01295 [Chthonomonadales bacterium]